MNHAPTLFGARQQTALVAELNDLLQLDYDAVAAYALALNALEDEGYQAAVRRFKLDHERHIDELTELIQEYDGTPIPAPHLSGAFKLAVQTAGALGGDKSVIRAFIANETQSRDNYRRAISRQHPIEVQGVLIRAARDEQRHFDWAMRTLAELGVDSSALADALEEMHVRNANVVEVVERNIRLAAAGLVLFGAGAAIMLLRRR